MAEDGFGMLHDWIAEHLTENLSLRALAQQAAMSERSFSRHYVEATGLTLARAVEHLRVEAARRLLSDWQLPVKRIAQQVRLRVRGNDATQLPPLTVGRSTRLC